MNTLPLIGGTTTTDTNTPVSTITNHSRPGQQPLITAEKDNSHQILSSNTQQPANYKRQLYNHDSEPLVKRLKGEEPQILIFDHQIAVVTPIMVSRFQQMVATYSCWKRNGFIIVLIFKKDEEEAIISILQRQAPDMMNSFILHPYMSNPSNAGIAKGAAYDFIKQNYLNDPNIEFAVLPDDTVNKMINTHTEKSIMTNPTEFYNTVIQFAVESPIFGGTVAYKRHRKKRHQKRCQRGQPARVERGFLQQALVFSCRGAPTLTKHFENIDEYITKMRGLTYRSVPFGEDVSFQIALYEHGILHQRESAQFWGIAISRIKHESATKQLFDQLNDEAKEALKDMMIYLQEQGVLTFSAHTNELSGVTVIPGRKDTHIGIEGERPWKEAYEYAFPSSKEEQN